MANDQFKAAAQTVDITPDLSRYDVRLHGYGARGSKHAEGVHDPIHAKILLLERGDTRAAIVTTDILQIDATLRQDTAERAALTGLTRENLVMTASHSHSAPAALEPRMQALPSRFNWFVAEYYEACVSKIVAGLKEAEARLVPARCASARTNLVGTVRNRRVPGYSYDSRAFTTPVGAGEVIDDELAVVHFVDDDDAVIATLVNLAGHGTVLGSDNMLISADWPGTMQRGVEQQLGGVCLFANGAEGNVAPDCGAGVLGFDEVDEFGGRIASHVTALMQELSPLTPTHFAIRSATLALPPFTLSEESPYVRGRLSRQEALDLIANRYPGQIEMTFIRLGDVGMVTIPGEMLTELSVDFKQRAAAKGIRLPLILGLANDSVAYIPSPQEYAKGGYEAGMCFYGPTLGTLLIDNALDGLRNLFA
jgi:hypothetical protein|tara:strand:+ start:634 stop:1902 length:1269 start_codon:yes stop_codon:yes gene_type:complete